MFQQNDVVTVVWDPKAKVLKYTKNGDTSNSYELSYDTLQGDRLCFCVSLSSNDETVEIVWYSYEHIISSYLKSSWNWFSNVE